MATPYEFRVLVSVNDDEERIVVVGDCPELGDWDPEQGFELPPLPAQHGAYGAVKEIDKEEINYRYVIMSRNPKLPGLPSPEVCGGEVKWRIQQFECHDRPRHRRALSETPLDVFGNIDGLCRTDHGWITKDSVIQLKFFNDAVVIWNESFVGKKARIRLSSYWHKGSVKSASVGPDCLRGYRNGPPLWFSSLLGFETLSFRPQPETGVSIGLDGNLCLTFQTALTAGVSKLGFMVEIFFDGTMNGEDGTNHADRAFSLLLPSHLSKSCGVLTVPLCTLDHELVGEIRVEHLVITPTQRSSHNFLSRLYSKNWRKSWVGLEIGHRGLGQSFAANTSCRATIRENTFHSFMEAGKNGADMIELDVHLTADKVPVIYHDFQAPVKLASKKFKNNGTNAFDLIGQESQFMLAIRDRTFTELQDIVINNESDFEKKMRESGGSDMDPLKDPFPSLKAVVETLDPSVGINVELKYPNHLTADSREFDRPFDMNEYVDTIIRTLEESPVERLLVLSCFNPDVCHALKLKQTAFPVLFLTQGITTKWPPYMDPRTKSTENAIRFAKGTELMGVSCHAEELLKEMALIPRCLNDGLVMFIWGEDTNDRSVIRQFKDLGVHGIIVDRLDALTEKVEKSSVLKRGSASL